MLWETCTELVNAPLVVRYSASRVATPNASSNNPWMARIGWALLFPRLRLFRKLRLITFRLVSGGSVRTTGNTANSMPFRKTGLKGHSGIGRRAVFPSFIARHRLCQHFRQRGFNLLRRRKAATPVAIQKQVSRRGLFNERDQESAFVLIEDLLATALLQAGK